MDYNILQLQLIEMVATDRIKRENKKFKGDFGIADTREEAISLEIDWIYKNRRRSI